MYDFDGKLYKLIDAALQEDVGDGDHSSLCCIPADAKGKAVLKVKQDGVLAGVDVAEKLFKYKKPSANFIRHKNDGDEMNYGEIAFEVETYVHTILQCERLVLNIMQRMSGIATITKQYTDKLNGYKTKLLFLLHRLVCSKVMSDRRHLHLPARLPQLTYKISHQNRTSNKDSKWTEMSTMFKKL